MTQPSSIARKKKGDKPTIDRSEDKEDLKELEEMTVPA
jgi:hypothetical protein